MASVGLIKFLDNILGSAICAVLSLFSRKKEIDTKEIKKVLFIQLWGIGETILTLPAVAAVKKKFSETDVYILSTDRNKEVYLSADMNINVLTVKMNPLSILRLMIYSFRKFDIVIDFEEYLNVSSMIAFFLGKQRMGFAHGTRAGLYNKIIDYDDEQHCTETFLDLVKLIGAEYKEKELVGLKYGKRAYASVSKILDKRKKIIGIVPGAAESAKAGMWPKEKGGKSYC